MINLDLESVAPTAIQFERRIKESVKHKNYRGKKGTGIAKRIRHFYSQSNIRENMFFKYRELHASINPKMIISKWIVHWKNYFVKLNNIERDFRVLKYLCWISRAKISLLEKSVCKFIDWYVKDWYIYFYRQYLNFRK